NLAAQVILPESMRYVCRYMWIRGQSNACSNTKTDESLTISDNIEITVLEIGKDRVKIGISAPKDVKIIRNELRDAQDMNKESSQALPKAAMEALLGMKKD
ncbi:Carbon storage regulator, partial [human gut metagenome]